MLRGRARPKEGIVDSKGRHGKPPSAGWRRRARGSTGETGMPTCRWLVRSARRRFGVWRFCYSGRPGMWAPFSPGLRRWWVGETGIGGMERMGEWGKSIPSPVQLVRVCTVYTHTHTHRAVCVVCVECVCAPGMFSVPPILDPYSIAHLPTYFQPDP